jgi:hypothetical protein
MAKVQALSKRNDQTAVPLVAKGMMAATALGPALAQLWASPLPMPSYRVTPLLRASSAKQSPFLNLLRKPKFCKKTILTKVPNSHSSYPFSWEMTMPVVKLFSVLMLIPVVGFGVRLHRRLKG